MEASAALSGLYNMVVIALWKWNTAPPVIADIALGEQNVPKGQSVMEAIHPDHPERHPAPEAEWLEPAEARSLSSQKPDGGVPPADKREGILKVRAADDIPTRQAIDQEVGPKLADYAPIATDGSSPPASG